MGRRPGFPNHDSLRTTILNLLTVEGAEAMSVEGIANRLGEPKRAVRSAVDALKYHGAIEAIGAPRARRYRLAPPSILTAYSTRSAAAPRIPTKPREWWEV